jgi:hypothetical protein
MTGQLYLDINPERRIDITLRNIDDAVAKSGHDVTKESWWPILHLVSHLRGMEMAESSIGMKNSEPLADAYDRLINPGDMSAVAAILATFRAVYGQSDNYVDAREKGAA